MNKLGFDQVLNTIAFKEHPLQPKMNLHERTFTACNEIFLDAEYKDRFVGYHT